MTILLAGLHYLAESYYLYFTFWWFDIPMHFLGGLLIGLLALWILFVCEKCGFSHVNSLLVFFVTLGVVLLVGSLWELFEVFTGITPITDIDLVDTLEDLLLDSLGAIVAFLYYHYRVHGKKSGQ